MKILEKKATFLCPHCEIQSLHLLVETTKELPGYTYSIWGKDKDRRLYEAQAIRNHLIYRCVNCEKDTYILFQGVAQARIVDKGLVTIEPPKIIHKFPVASLSIHISVPENVKRATFEAELCLSVGAYNACGVMARRAINSLCQDKGAKGKDLYEQLQFLRNNHMITPDLWEWAEELRVVGRSGAHPEWEKVSADEADYAIRFLREIIRYVYINPYERAQRRLRETKKKKGAQDSPGRKKKLLVEKSKG